MFLTTHYMEEADRVADRIAIIDHGRIVAQGSPGELKQQTGSETLEQAFLALTGSSIREEEANPDDPHAEHRPLVETLTRGRHLCSVAPPGKVLHGLPVRIIGSLGQPLLFLIGLGFGLGPVFQKAGQGNYIQFLAPGVIAMTVLFTSVFSGIELIWDRQFGFLKETLVTPVSRLTIMIGRVLGGATVAVGQGLIVCAFCLAAGFRFSGLAAPPTALLFMAPLPYRLWCWERRSRRP